MPQGQIHTAELQPTPNLVRRARRPRAIACRCRLPQLPEGAAMTAVDCWALVREAHSSMTGSSLLVLAYCRSARQVLGHDGVVLSSFCIYLPPSTCTSFFGACLLQVGITRYLPFFSCARLYRLACAAFFCFLCNEGWRVKARGGTRTGQPLHTQSFASAALAR